MTIKEYQKQVAGLKHQSILNAASKIFLTVGYERTTLEMIAKEAGVSTATLYKHFPTKRAVFGEIMEVVWDVQLKFVDAIDNVDIATKLLIVGKKYVSLLRQPNIEALFRVIIAEAQRFPELGEELYRRGKEPFLKNLHFFLQTEVNNKKLEIEDIPLAARQFLGMINDLVFWPKFLITDLEISDAEVERVITEATETFMARYLVRK
jgi:TetR/AcrR family transcriptional regulator, regulator of autoinduction and epiphytic fitness